MTALVSAPVRTAKNADHELEGQIRRQLAADSRAVTRLQIEVSKGMVRLRGVATSFYQKQLWLHGTKRVAGDDVAIIDEIEVAASWETSDLSWRD